MTDMTNLDNLHDIIPLEPPPFWPPAPGWYVVAFATSVALVWLAVTWYLKWKENRYRREALAELDRIEQRATDASVKGVTLRKLPELVKRTALAAYSRETVAPLTGLKWMGFLDKTLSTTEFTNGPGQLLLQISYRNHEALDELSAAQTAPLLALLRTWIKHHETNALLNKRWTMECPGDEKQQ